MQITRRTLTVTLKRIVAYFLQWNDESLETFHEKYLSFFLFGKVITFLFLSFLIWVLLLRHYHYYLCLTSHFAFFDTDTKKLRCSKISFCSKAAPFKPTAFAWKMMAFCTIYQFLSGFTNRPSILHHYESKNELYYLVIHNWEEKYKLVQKCALIFCRTFFFTFAWEKWNIFVLHISSRTYRNTKVITFVPSIKVLCNRANRSIHLT